MDSLLSYFILVPCRYSLLSSLFSYKAVFPSINFNRLCKRIEALGNSLASCTKHMMANSATPEGYAQHQQQVQQQLHLLQQHNQQQQQLQLQQQQHRSILPRPTNTNDGEHSDGRSGTVAKRQQVLVACAACQRRKSKCTGMSIMSFHLLGRPCNNDSGQRPRCSLCELKDTECVYDTRAGEARGAHLKRKVTELTQEIQYLRDLINTLRTAPYDEAQGLLQRIQSTSELEEACKLISDSSLLLSVRKRSSMENHNIDQAIQTVSPSPTPSESGKRKRSSGDETLPRKDPRMSIEHMTSNTMDTSDEAYRRKAAAYSAAVMKSNDGLLGREPDLQGWGFVTSDQTE